MRKMFLLICCLALLAHVAHGKLTATKYPGTVEDLSFTSRVELAAEGYKPFLDKSAYQELNIVPGEEIYTDRMIAQAEAAAEEEQKLEDYCKQHPEDKTKCQQKPTEPTPTVNYSGGTIGGGPVIVNNSVTGGSCYPAAKDNWYKNKIFTTGRYEKRAPAFEKAMITVFRKEGTTCGTIPKDPGGYSCYGIASKMHNIPPEVLNKYTIADAEDFYYEKFWKPQQFYKLPDVIASDVFLAGVASGTGTAMIQFRNFLGLPESSKGVDDQVINAVKNYQGDIHNKWLDKRDTFLQRVVIKRGYSDSVARSYKHAIEIKRKNGCHVQPQEPLYRQ